MSDKQTDALIRANTLIEVSQQLTLVYEDGQPKPDVRFAKWLRFQLQRALGDLEREAALNTKVSE